MRILPVGTASGALLSVAVIGSLLLLAPVSAHAQWWRSGPADFEDCAASAEKAGKEVDNAVGQVGQQVQKAGASIEDAAKGNKK